MEVLGIRELESRLGLLTIATALFKDLRWSRGKYSLAANKVGLCLFNYNDFSKEFYDREFD